MNRPEAAAPRQANVNNFDLIRLFAASEVAVKHGLVHLGFGVGWLEAISYLPGVPIFFFISGFLIYQSFLNSDRLGIFAANRVYRLFPALYLCLALSVALVAAFGALTWAEVLSPQFWIWLGAQGTIAQFYNPDFLRDFGIGVVNGSLWTISVELQFYILTPMLAWIVSRFKPIWAIGILVSLAANLLLSSLDPEATRSKLLMVTFLPWFYMFMTGAWLASRRDLVQRIANLPWLVTLAIFIGAILLSKVTGLGATGNGIGPVAFVGVVFVILKCAYSMPDLSDRLLRRNDISYGIYIYHMLAVNAAVALGLTGQLWAFFAAMAVTVVVALLSWRLVERPALQAKKRTLRQV